MVQMACSSQRESCMEARDKKITSFSPES